jgi:hypothetical protein
MNDSGHEEEWRGSGGEEANGRGERRRDFINHENKKRDMSETNCGT